MILTPLHWVGIVATIVSVIVLGVYAGRRVKSASDFLVAGRTMGPALVAGCMLGTILGGSSTIGTVELAFKCGLTALWWTLGSGLGCLVLGVGMCRVIRREEFPTIGLFIMRSFGSRAGTAATLVLIIGLYFAFMSNVLSSFAMLSSVFALPTGGLALVTGVSIVAYVVLGGLWGASIVGVLKICLIAFSLIVSAAAAWVRLGNPLRIVAELPAYPWLSLFGRGIWVDLGSGVGITIGLLTTQMYLQALAGARSDAVARTGAFVSAILAPLFGSLGAFIGLSMRLTDPGIVPSQALPTFVAHNLPPVLAGVALGTFFIAAVGTAAGIALGISGMVTNDLLGYRNRPDAGRSWVPLTRLAVTRGTVFATIAVGIVVACYTKPAFILQLSITSMGLRTSAAAPAFLAAAAFGKRLRPAAGVWSIAGGSAAYVCARAALPAIEPVLPALAVSVACLAFASLVRPAHIGTSSRG